MKRKKKTSMAEVEGVAYLPVMSWLRDGVQMGWT